MSPIVEREGRELERERERGEREGGRITYLAPTMAKSEPDY